MPHFSIKKIVIVAAIVAGVLLMVWVLRDAASPARKIPTSSPTLSEDAVASSIKEEKPTHVIPTH